MRWILLLCVLISSAAAGDEVRHKGQTTYWSTVPGFQGAITSLEVCGYASAALAREAICQLAPSVVVGLGAESFSGSGSVTGASCSGSTLTVDYVIYTESGGQTYTNNHVATRSIGAGEDGICEDECEQGLIETFGYTAGTWTDEAFQFTGGPASICSAGCTYNSSTSSALDVLWYPDGTIWVNEEFVSDGSECSGQPDAPSETPPGGEAGEEWPEGHYCDQGGGSDGVSFCDTRDPDHPEYDPNLPPTDPGAIYCDEQGGHDGRSFCNTWSPHHPAHPDYDGTGDGDGGTSGDGSYPGPGGGGTGGTGEGGEGEDPPQIGFCPPGTVQSERHFHGEDQTAVCVPEGDEFDESLDGLDLSGELPPGWLVMPTLPEPSAGTCSCPEDHVISVMGSSVPISYGPICGVAELLRPVFLLLVYLGLAFFLFRMVAGGNK